MSNELNILWSQSRTKRNIDLKCDITEGTEKDKLEKRLIHIHDWLYVKQNKYFLLDGELYDINICLLYTSPSPRDS